MVLPTHLRLEYVARTTHAALSLADTMTVAELREAAAQAAERRAAVNSAAIAAPPDAVMTDSAAPIDAPERSRNGDVDVADTALQEGVLADGSGSAVAPSAAAAVKPETGDEAEEVLPRDGPSASQCPVCLEPMAAKVPHIYPCGHVFCRECSEKVHLISCPWMQSPAVCASRPQFVPLVPCHLG